MRSMRKITGIGKTLWLGSASSRGSLAMSSQARDETSAEKLLNLLMTFADLDGHVPIIKIRRHCGGSRSTTYRYLQTLKRFGLVEESEKDGYYRLGPSITRLAHSMLHERDFISRTQPIMRSLAVDTGESTLLSRRARDRIVVLAFVDSEKMLRVNMAAAENLPIHRGSFGKLYLAFDSRVRRQGASSSRRSQSVLTEQELNAIRRSGYSTSCGEVEVGAASISVPILSPSGDLFAALTVAGPSARLTQSAIRTYLPEVFRAARSITAIAKIAISAKSNFRHSLQNQAELLGERKRAANRHYGISRSRICGSFRLARTSGTVMISQNTGRVISPIANNLCESSEGLE